MYFVYILKSFEHAKTYVGITDNLKRRIDQHNAGYHAYTKRYKQWRILHTEQFKDRQNASIREKYLKSSAGRKWIKRVLFSEP